MQPMEIVWNNTFEIYHAVVRELTDGSGKIDVADVVVIIAIDCVYIFETCDASNSRLAALLSQKMESRRSQMQER